MGWIVQTGEQYVGPFRSKKAADKWIFLNSAKLWFASTRKLTKPVPLESNAEREHRQRSECIGMGPNYPADVRSA